jgi:hypothetical protein
MSSNKTSIEQFAARELLFLKADKRTVQVIIRASTKFPFTRVLFGSYPVQTLLF